MPSRQSQSSVHIDVDGRPLFAQSRRQAAVATSSGEAEYYSAAAAVAEGMLIREVLLFFGMRVVGDPLA